MPDATDTEIKTLQRMTVAQLKDRYHEVFGEPTRAHHREGRVVRARGAGGAGRADVEIGHRRAAAALQAGRHTALITVIWACRSGLPIRVGT